MSHVTQLTQATLGPAPRRCQVNSESCSLRRCRDNLALALRVAGPYLSCLLCCLCSTGGCSVLFSADAQSTDAGGVGLDSTIGDSPDANLDTGLFDCGPFALVKTTNFGDLAGRADWVADDVNSAITAGPKLLIDIAKIPEGDAASLANNAAEATGDFAIDLIVEFMPESGDSFVRFKLFGNNSNDITIKLFKENVKSIIESGDSSSDRSRAAGPIHLRFTRVGNIVDLETSTDGELWNQLHQYTSADVYKIRFAGGRDAPVTGSDSNIVIRSIGAGCISPGA